ncbi:Zn-ribbon domain-containing OB-fold protein [Pseudonocardia alni]|uniref:ChsH2 C-terminal OB-fold domain-containing protein n=1 Tax=Pseudonocardia alni TaxID=33907 RepID=A0A852WG38_PSEA5|nr:OB-fold domain-containing protein [Pseudonocardia antarctica]NYG05235.1 hypothetical protein [Pseudonocardia antarctica]
MSLPVPRTTDPDQAEFWAGVAEGRLLVAIGQDGTAVHPPRNAGHNTPIRWVEAAGTARLHSWTVTVHTVDPAFPAPYTVVLVELDDHPGVRFVGNVPGAPDLRPGQPMRVRFDDRAGVVVPQWEPM